MGRVLLGFVTGIVVALVAVAYFRSARDLNAPIAEADLVRSAATPVSDKAQENENALSQPSSAQETNALAAAPEDFNVRREQAQTRVNEARALLSERLMELTAIQTKKWRMERPITSPLALPADFEWLSNSDQLNEYDAIQREPRDFVWAAMTEAKLVEYISSHPEIIDTFGYPSVLECRTTRCALTFRRYGFEGRLYETTALLSSMFSSFFEQASGNGLPDMGTDDANIEDGLTTIYWGLMSQERATAPSRERCDRPDTDVFVEAWCDLNSN